MPEPKRARARAGAVKVRVGCIDQGVCVCAFVSCRQSSSVTGSSAIRTDCGVSFEHLNGSSTECVCVSVYSVCVCVEGAAATTPSLIHRLVTQQRLIMAEVKGGYRFVSPSLRRPKDCS